MRMLKYLISSQRSLQVDVAMPAGAVIRKVGLLPEQFTGELAVFAWAEVPVGVQWEDESPELRTFRVVMTGGEVPEGRYLGTIINNAYVAHVYELSRR